MACRITRGSGRFVATAGFLCLCLFTSSADAEAPIAQSSTYRLAQAGIGSAAGESVSPTFALDGLAGQAGPVGESASATFAVQSGFWTSGFDGPVPVDLIYFTVVPDEEDVGRGAEVMRK